MRFEWNAPRPQHLPGDEAQFGRQVAESGHRVGFAVLGAEEAAQEGVLGMDQPADQASRTSQPPA
jgi:hypothetical protein